MALKGLLIFTGNHKIRALDVAGPLGLFTIHTVKSAYMSALVRKGEFRLIEGEDYVKLLSAFSSIMRIAARMTGSRYYTFLGEYRLTRSLTYEPYVDLMKKATVKITPMAVRITYGEQTKSFRRTTGGYTAGEMLNTFRRIINMVHRGD